MGVRFASFLTIQPLMYWKRSTIILGVVIWERFLSLEHYFYIEIISLVATGVNVVLHIYISKLQLCIPIYVSMWLIISNS